jgi:PAS domain S-box-containing protein
VNILGSPLPDGGTIGVITDMSLYIEKKESENLLLDAIRHSLQGIILMKKKKIASWNRGAKFILGYKESEVSGKSLVGIFMNEDIKRIYETRDEDIEVEVLGKRKDGERIPLILTIVWSKDDPETCIILIRNISHIRKSEEIISQKHDYLMQTVKEYGIIKRKMEYFQELERLFYKGNTDLQKIYDFFVYSIAHIADV